MESNNLEDIDFVTNQRRTKEEIDEDVEYFINHPLNAKELTPEMLELPEF